MEERLTEEHRRYRIKTPTMAIYAVDGQRTTAMVPVGMIVFTTQSHLDGDALIEVTWNDRKYLMFTQDLRERSELVVDSASVIPQDPDSAAARKQRSCEGDADPECVRVHPGPCNRKT